MSYEDDEDERGMGDNSMAADERLRLLVERYENLEEERKGIMDDQKDVVLEAKAVGYDPKVFRQVIKIRKQNPDDRKEMEALLDVYMAALGML
jgi:uncharacterized protein (UPF0335 family)